jgi:AcrR family transcriptional regulator
MDNVSIFESQPSHARRKTMEKAQRIGRLHGQTVHPCYKRLMSASPDKTLEKPEARPRRDATRARICTAAREVFLREGYNAATIEQIAAEAGTRRSTLYNHFRDKNEILEAISEDYLAGVLRVVALLPSPRPSRRQIDRWIADFADFVLQERAPTLLIVQFSGGLDVPPATRQFGMAMMKALGERLPAFAEALEPGQDQALVRANTVLRELSLALGAHLQQEGRGLAPHMLEVAGDLLEQFVKGWF